ncbi:hypothetical protein BDN70DRAFT_902204 [Pholiota conissans]|uniref:Uncharacterized protein n=1 Tax=Pholiota conissans TaxID=109636 RepID=A0A9P6CKS4_9AGAR|nr:hypothetical protein BDN70DRAFT_902204 [Pholiota conissans]
MTIPLEKRRTLQQEQPWAALIFCPRPPEKGGRRGQGRGGLVLVPPSNALTVIVIRGSSIPAARRSSIVTCHQHASRMYPLGEDTSHPRPSLEGKDVGQRLRRCSSSSSWGRRCNSCVLTQQEGERVCRGGGAYGGTTVGCGDCVSREWSLWLLKRHPLLEGRARWAVCVEGEEWYDAEMERVNVKLYTLFYRLSLRINAFIVVVHHFVWEMGEESIEISKLVLSSRTTRTPTTSDEDDLRGWTSRRTTTVSNMPEGGRWRESYSEGRVQSGERRRNPTLVSFDVSEGGRRRAGGWASELEWVGWEGERGWVTRTGGASEREQTRLRRCRPLLTPPFCRVNEDG